MKVLLLPMVVLCTTVPSLAEVYFQVMRWQLHPVQSIGNVTPLQFFLVYVADGSTLRYNHGIPLLPNLL